MHSRLLSSSSPRRWTRLVPCWLTFFAAVVGHADGLPPVGSGPSLDPPRFVAQPEQKALLRVERPGRYAVWARSDQGTAIRLVDRRTGPGELFGQSGASDGRIDAFLERGDYQVIAYSPGEARGEVKLEAKLFEQLETSDVRLPARRLVETSLGDLQERSYWLQLDQPTWIFLEAAGRHLSDLRVWRDGGWLVDTTPSRREIAPRKGRPLRSLELNCRLPAGLYRVALYGGQGLAWTDDDNSKPLYLRRGWPQRGEAGRSSHVLGPLGVDHFLVPEKATYFRLELPGRGLPAGPELSLEIAGYEETEPVGYVAASGSITKETSPPIVELNESYYGAGKGWRRVSVRGTPGERYVLQHFNDERLRIFDEPGRYWLASIHSGDPGDQLDATGIFARWPERGARYQPLDLVAADTIELTATTHWHRRFNHEGNAELFLHVATLGEWEFKAPGTNLRVMPFAAVNEDYGVSGALGRGTLPPLQYGEARYQLDPGYYVLTLQANEPDIRELFIRATGAGRSPTVESAAQPAASLGPQTLSDGYRYVLYVNEVPEKASGTVFRKLPLNLREPLPVVLRGEVALPAQTALAGRYRAVADNGLALVVSVDGKEWQKEAWVEPGSHQVVVKRADGRQDALTANVFFEAAEDLQDQPLPPLPADVLASLPVFPLLDERQERYLDLAATSSKTFLLQVKESALYRIESTGLLDTAGQIRTPLVPQLATAGDNGSGRNFLIQQYLRPGDYQLTVGTEGRSAGHLGVKLSRSPLLDGGELIPASVARAALEPGVGVAYRFRVDTPGKFRLRALALGKTLPIRLEDADGWPVVQPGLPGDLEVSLVRGDYRLIVLPSLVGARQITRLEAVLEPPSRVGHGPHPLVVGTSMANRWHEPAAGQERLPDVWTWTLPAAVPVSISLDAEMAAVIYAKQAGRKVKVADIPPGRPWLGELPAGELELHATCSRRNNQVDYRLLVRTDYLMAGHPVRVTPPGEIAMAVGEESLVELASFGSSDVQAKVFDANGVLVASADDRPGDWNFSWTGRLAAGRYSVRLGHVGPASPVELGLRLPQQHENPPATLPLAKNLKLGDVSEIFDVKLPTTPGSLLVARAESNGFVRLAVEEQSQGRWTTLAARDGKDARLVVWTRPGASYRLRVENLGQGEVGTALRAASANWAPAKETALRSGLTPRAVAGVGEGLGLLMLDLDREGCFELQAGEVFGTLTGAGQTDLAAQSGQRVFPSTGRNLVVVADPRRELRLRRWIWDGQDTELVIPGTGQAACDLAPSAGWRLLEAAALKEQPSIAEADDLAAQAVAAGRATSLLPGNIGRFAVRGLPGSALKLRSQSFGAAAEQNLALGRAELEVAAGRAIPLVLPPGAKQIRLLLDRGLVARLEGGDGEKARVFWADPVTAQPLDLVLDAAATRLTIANPGSFAGRFTAETLPSSAGLRVVAGAPVEKKVSRAGWYELEVVPGSTVVHLRGGKEATFLGSDGTVSFGTDFRVPADGGRLLVAAESGLLWVWSDRREEGGIAALWADLPLPAGKPVPTPSVVALVEAVEAFDVDLGQPGILHLRADRGGVVAAELPGLSEPLVAVFGEAIEHDLYLATGRARFAIRPVGGLAEARLELSSSAVTPIGEGLGPSVLLGPGLSRYFSFEVPARQLVGWAVRADAGIAMGRLFAADGREIRQAATELRELAKGTYLLGLTIPSQARPTVVRPVLVGLEERSTLPPAELIERYVRGDLPLPGEAAGTPPTTGDGEADETSDEGGEEEGEGEFGEDELGEDEGYADEDASDGSEDEGYDGEEEGEVDEEEGEGDEGGGEGEASSPKAGR